MAFSFLKQTSLLSGDKLKSYSELFIYIWIIATYFA